MGSCSSKIREKKRRAKAATAEDGRPSAQDGREAGGGSQENRQDGAANNEDALSIPAPSELGGDSPRPIDPSAEAVARDLEQPVADSVPVVVQLEHTATTSAASAKREPEPRSHYTDLNSDCLRSSSSSGNSIVEEKRNNARSTEPAVKSEAERRLRLGDPVNEEGTGLASSKTLQSADVDSSAAGSAGLGDVSLHRVEPAAGNSGGPDSEGRRPVAALVPLTAYDAGQFCGLSRDTTVSAAAAADELLPPFEWVTVPPRSNWERARRAQGLQNGVAPAAWGSTATDDGVWDRTGEPRYADPAAPPFAQPAPLPPSPPPPVATAAATASTVTAAHPPHPNTFFYRLPKQPASGHATGLWGDEDDGDLDTINRSNDGGPSRSYSDAYESSDYYTESDYSSSSHRTYSTSSFSSSEGAGDRAPPVRHYAPPPLDGYADLEGIRQRGERDGVWTNSSFHHVHRANGTLQGNYAHPYRAKDRTPVTYLFQTLVERPLGQRSVFQLDGV